MATLQSLIGYKGKMRWESIKGYFWHDQQLKTKAGGPVYVNESMTFSDNWHKEEDPKEFLGKNGINDYSSSHNHNNFFGNDKVSMWFSGDLTMDKARAIVELFGKL